jgi:hypothetical protein
MSFIQGEYSCVCLCRVAQVDGGCLRTTSTLLFIQGREKVCSEVLNYQVDLRVQ